MIKRVVYSNCVVYEVNGLDHNPSGPAVIWDNGDWCWGLSNLIHRYYGAAVHSGEWYIHGYRILAA